MSQSSGDLPLALHAADVPARLKPSNYPEPFASRMAGRVKRQLGDQFGLKNFGVNLATLNPGAASSLQHRHTVQDEFVYVLEGEVVLVSRGTETTLGAGMCAGFPASGSAHHLENRSASTAIYLEIGDRTPGDAVTYPDDDLLAVRSGDRWLFTHRDGSAY